MVRAHGRRSIVLHRPNPSMMVQVLTQYFHVVLVRSVRVHAGQAVVHGVMGNLGVRTDEVARNSLVPNEDSFQWFVVQDGTRFFGCESLARQLSNTLETFAFDGLFGRFLNLAEWSCDLRQLGTDVRHNLVEKQNDIREL